MLTPEEKRQHLTEGGFDPNQYDIVDNGDSYKVVRTNNVSPSVSAQTTPNAVAAPNQDGFGTVAARTGIRALPAVAGGMAGAEAGSALGLLGGPFSPITVPVGGILGAIGGSIAGHYAADKAKEALLSTAQNQQIQQQQQQDQLEHPWAVRTGSLAAQVAGGMSPSPGNLLSAGKTLTSPALYAGRALAPEIQNLANVGIGAAIPAVQGIYQGQSAKDVLLDTLTGALLNKPNAIGQRVWGMSAMPDVIPHAGPEGKQVLNTDYLAKLNEVEPQLVASANPDIQNSQPTISPLSVLNQVTSSGVHTQGRGKQAEKFVPNKSAEESAAFIKDGGEVLPRQAVWESAISAEPLSQYQQDQLVKQKDFEAASHEKAAQDLLEQRKAKAELDRQEAAQLQSENAARALELKQSLEKSAVQPSDSLPKPLATTELGKEIMPDYTGNTEVDSVTTQRESAKDLELRKLEGNTGDRYQPKGQETVGDDTVIHHDPDKSLSLPERQVNALNYVFQKLGKKRGVQLNPINGRIMTKARTEIDPVTGAKTVIPPVEINGMAAAREGIKDVMAYVNQDKPDTWPHELLHPFMQDLRASKNPKDVTLLGKIEEAVTKSKRFQEINDARVAEKKDPWNAEEFLAQRGGEVLSQEVMQGPKSEWSDVWARLKLKFGNPTYEDAVRVLNHRMANDAPFDSAEINPRVSGGGQRNQEGDSKGAKDADYAFEHDLSGFMPEKGIVKFYNLKKDLVDPVTGEIKHGVGSTVSEETLKKFGITKYQEKDAEEVGYSRPLVTATEKLLSKPNVTKLVAANDGTYPTENLKARIEKSIPKDELSALRDAGWDEFFIGKARVTPKEVQQWLDTNGPKVEVKKLDAQSKQSPDAKRYADLTHTWFDRLPVQLRHEVQRYVNDYNFDAESADTSSWRNQALETASEHFDDRASLNSFRTTMDEYAKLHKQDQWRPPNQSSNDSATARYTMVNPKPLDKMEGAVDILVRKPTKKLSRNTLGDSYDSNNLKDLPSSVKFSGNHFGSSDKNIVGWTRGYMETLPNGKKVFHVFEIQSDWAQKRQQALERIKSGDHRSGNTIKGGEIDEPLLNHYERLALKAAIHHAIENGADAIAISDSKTAMLTEGHDRHVQVADGIYEVPELKGTSAKKYAEGSNRELDYPLTGRIKLENGNKYLESKEYGWLNAETITSPMVTGSYINAKLPKSITQQKGMELHYDNTVPNILEHLTGSKGSEVNFGEHKNAITTKSLDDGFGDSLEGERTYPRSDLIIKDNQGNPKTDITAKMYDLQGVKQKLQKGEDFGIFTKYQEGDQPQVGPDKPERASMLGAFTGVYDKVEQKFRNDPDPKVRQIASKVTQQLKKYAGEADYLTGQFGNKLIQATKDYEPSEIQRVYKHLYQRDDTGFSSVALTEHEQKLAAEITEVLREPKKMQKDLGLMVKRGEDYRVAGMKKDGYMFNVLNPEVAYEWSNNSRSAKSRQYDQAWLEHAKKKNINKDEAQQLLDLYKAQMSTRNVGGDKDVDYGPIRKAEGIGLPYELAEQNFNAASMMYAKRAAKDLAFYKHLQSQPDIRHTLMLKDQFGNIPEAKDMPDVPRLGTDEVVQDALKSVTGASRIENPRTMAVARLIANGVMGVGTAAKNLASLPVNIAPYLQADQVGLLGKAILNLKDSSKRAFESGAVKANFSDFEGAGIYEGNPNPWVRYVNKVSQALRKYQGRDLSDKLEGELLYSLGELIVPSTVEKAKAGNKDSLNLLKRMSDLVEGGHEAILKGKELTADDTSRMAKRFTDITRGTYGPEGLPQWALEGSLAPFAALSRFGIEKSNMVQKDVINPIVRDGNFGPLLKTALTALGVGVGVEELNELLNGRKANDPTVKEVTNYGNEKDVAAKAIGLLQLASFGGIASDIAKSGANLAEGKPMKYSNPLSFPLQSFVQDTLASNISKASDAMQAGEDKFQVLTHLIGDIATQSIQSLRYVKNNTYGADDSKEADKFRDLRTYEEMSGKPSKERGVDVNQYMDLNGKKFKKTTNMEEAQALLPEIIKKYASQYKDDPTELYKKLKGLKSMSYKTMPNPDDKEAPDEFYKYLDFLSKTQGPDKARQAVEDYFLHDAANEVKSEMVP